ncbi:MAG: hypothetical protein JW904_01050 [Spirochaetales bacterium]|nr:hypothetical protein [Spirochaetales bacterium]
MRKSEISINQIMSFKKILSYKLKPRELESQYREETLKHNKYQSLFISVFMIVILAGFALLDSITLPRNSELVIILITRISVVVLSIPGIFFVIRLRLPRQLDATAFLWTMLVITHLLIVGVLHETNFMILIIWDIAAIITIYFGVPMPLSAQITGALYLTAGSSLLYLVIKHIFPEPFEIISISVSYLFCNVLGIFISLQLKRGRRNQFVLLKTEREIRQRLEAASVEIKTLQGILPICSYCKKVRDDKGYWDQIDSYLAAHTDATFSHGMCPDCLQKHHPEVYKKYRDRPDKT